MNLYKKAKTFYKGGVSALSKKSSILSDFSFPGSTTGNTLKSDTQKLSVYEQIVWVSACVDAISRDAGGREYTFQNKLTGERVEERRIDERITLPFEIGFYNDSFEKLMKSRVSHRLLTGNGYFWKTSNTAYGKINKVADTFVPLQPNECKPIVAQHGLALLGYEISLKDGRRFTVGCDEIIQFKQNAIFNPFIGVGNVTKARVIAEGELAGDQFVNEFLQRRAVPSLVITEQAGRSSEEHDRINSMIESKYQGKQNAGKVLYLAGEQAKVTAIQLSQKDLQFMEQKEFNRQAIITIFGCNPTILGIPEGSNKAIAQTMRLNYLANTVNPMIEDMENDLNKQHVNMIDPNIQIKFKRHTTGDVDTVKKMVETGIITPNRASELLGEEADKLDEARNMFYMASNLVPVGYVEKEEEAEEVDEPEEQQEQEEGKAVVSCGCGVDHSVKKRLDDPQNYEEICNEFTKSATRTKQFQVKYLRSALKSQSAIENRYTMAISKYFKRQGERVLAKFAEKYSAKEIDGLDIDSVDVFYGINFENVELQKELKPLHTSGIQRAIKDINAITGYGVNDSINNPFVSASIGRLAKRVAGTWEVDPVTGKNIRVAIGDTTKKALEKLVQKAIDEDLGVGELTKMIENKFEQFQGYRARVIARTESSRAYMAGAEVAYKEIGVTHIDMVGCVGLGIEQGGLEESDCGKQNVPIEMMSTLRFHPNHTGAPAPSKEV